MATNPIQELEQNARRRKLMEAMQMQAMSGAPTGGANATQAIIQALARAGMGAMAGMGQGQLDASDTVAREAYSQQLGGEMNRFMDTRQGTPETPLPPDLAGPPKPGMPADPRRAIVQAMTSQYPEMRELGKLEMTQLGKGENREKFGNPVTEMDPASGKGIQVQYGDQGTRKVVSGAEPYKPKAGKPFRLDGDLYQEDNEGFLKKLDNAPKTTVNVGGPTVHLPGQKKGFEEWAKAAVGDVQEMGKQARNATQLVGTLNQMVALDDGKFSGPLADPAVWLTNLGQSVGIPVDKASLANAENYSSLAGDVAQRVISVYGGNRGVTKEEAAIIQRSVPQLQHSPQARAQLSQILLGIAQRNVEDYNMAAKNLNDALKTEDMSKYTFANVSVPNTTPIKPAVTPAGTPATKVPTLQEYLKKQREGK